MMQIPTNSLAVQLDIPAYTFGIAILMLVMIFHGICLLQTAKRYEVKAYLYLAEKRYAEVTKVFYQAILLLLITHLFEILIWGLFIYSFGLITHWSQSVLFSGSAYTAIGFMDDTLPEGWRMLAVIIAFSGLFSFAWTASVMISMTRSFRKAYTRMHMHKLNLSQEIIDRFE
ncbi:hypothetical protein ICU98_03560 [Polynucleobacter sp. MWH-P3-07-1]|uniref:ion channel n=1 Tax=Polynucleobacter sp. MWH-P3-07-1 TaxID=1743173 RepID=UPI001BFD9138|nr:ion channel [Polynucleobacter sp. MWH-P3-07-1]QWD84148.1 hypothetical protein ICU98_03560 [Polynucleobacter sp. MWH-P3-07-1]